jgi:serine/threonine-protein kinase
MHNLVAEIRAEQRAEWQAGRRVSVEKYLDRHPALWNDDEAVLDVICSEILLTEEMGEPVDLDGYLQRFPKYAEELRRQRAFDEMVPILAASQATVPEHRPAGVGQETVKFESPERSSYPAVPGYEIQRVLGEGSHGIVYLARQLSLAKLVALKMLRGGDLARPEERKLLRRDAEVLAKLEHPNIVRIIDFGESGGRSFYSMEYVKGRSLEDRLKAGPLPARDAAQLVETLARALHAVHQQHIVHRDLKPANILLDENGTPKVADFGLAKRLGGDASLAASGQLVGNIAHMAPEQTEGKAGGVGPAADVWALGVILYEALSGRQPFEGASLLETIDHIRRRKPDSLQKHGVDRVLEAICVKCLEKGAPSRFASAEDLADELRRWLQRKPTRTRPPGWLVRHPLVVAAAFVLVVAVAAPVVVYETNPRRAAEAIDRKLATGEEVALIGPIGPPKWHEFATIDPSQETHLQDGTFSVKSWGLTLVDLVRNMQSSEYSISTWVRHDEGLGVAGEVGIYFARSRRPQSNGIEHLLYTVKLNGLNDARKSNAGSAGNPVQLRIERQFEPYRIGNMCTAGLPAYLPIESTDQEVWRKLLVKVMSDRIQVTVWRDAQLWNESESTTVLLRDLTNAMETVHNIDVPETVPPISFHGALGLYVFKGSASFKNTIVYPRSE